MERNIKVGQIWKHYKNPNHHYEIVGIAKDSQTLEDKVVYKALYESEFGFGTLWVRPKKEFLEKVSKEEKEQNRFELIK